MGLARRKRRLKNFPMRADAFKRALNTNPEKASTIVERDLRKVVVGKGTHKRLIMKSNLKHIKIAEKIELILQDYFYRTHTKPKSYTLTPIHSHQGVQEYFSRPSIESAGQYLFNAAKRNSMKKNSPDDYLICKRFFGEKYNANVARKNVLEAYNELLDHMNLAHPGMGEVLSSNIIILGTTREGKIRLAIVDV